MKLRKWIALIIVLGLLLRGLVALEADATFDALIQAAIGDGDRLEAAVLSQSSLLMATAAPPLPEAEPEDVFEASSAVEDAPPPEAEPEALSAYIPTLPDLWYTPSTTDPQMTRSDLDSRQRAAKIYLRNHTAYSIDIEGLLTEPLSFDPGAGGPTVLILHTHGTEAFTPDGGDWYDNVDNYRTSDKSLNVIRVGEEIAAVFESRGIAVLHDRQLHDYPSFRGSYGRSLTTAEWYLARYPEIQIIIDVHRDAIPDGNGGFVRTMADIEGYNSAQVMLVVGTDHAGLYHPDWRENLKFALRLHAAMAEQHPSLVRPLRLREERFNAHLAPGAILVEIGTCANTLQEALVAARFFAASAADVILGDG
ncbi:MAG: stage II sporulation protein P [Oscillospiraceae bacterium]|nr:stage II sporulation protein P [Oscillospiraceae bacterium]